MLSLAAPDAAAQTNVLGGCAQYTAQDFEIGILLGPAPARTVTVHEITASGPVLVSSIYVRPNVFANQTGCNWVAHIDEAVNGPLEVLLHKDRLYQITMGNQSYLYALDYGTGFFSSRSSGIPDVLFIGSSTGPNSSYLRVYPVRLGGGAAGRDVDDFFPDHRWVLPFDVPTICASTGCDPDDARDYPFLIPAYIEETYSLPVTIEAATSADWRIPSNRTYTWSASDVAAINFGVGGRVTVNGTLNTSGVTMTASDPAQGWGGVHVAGGTSTFGAGTVIENVVTAAGAVLVSTANSVFGTIGSGQSTSHVVLEGVSIDGTRGGGAGLLVTGAGATASVGGMTIIRDNTAGPGVSASWGGRVTVDSDGVRITRNAGGILATGTGARALVLEGRILNNTGPGLRATSGARLDVLRDDASGTTSLTSNDPVQVFDNVGGLYAEPTGSQGGAVVSSGGDFVCVQEPCPSIGGHDFRRNTQPAPGGGLVYDALARGSSQVIASRNYWDGRTSAQVITLADKSSSVDVSNALASPPSVGGPAGNRSTAGNVHGKQLDPATASRGRVDAAVQALLSQADGLMQRGDSTRAAERIVSAAAIVTSDDDRFAVSEAAGRALAVVWPPALVAWAETAAASPGSRAWGRRALAVGLAGHGRTAEARTLAQALADEDGAGTDSTAEAHRARGLGLLVGIAVADDDAVAAVAALGALVEVDAEGAAERAVQVALAFPGTTVSFARGAGVAGRAAQPASLAGKTTTPAELAGVSLAAGPNPSSGSVRVVLTVAVASDVRVSVFDALGREVAVLHDGPAPVGPLSATFAGASQPAGVYVVRAVVRGAGGASQVLVQRVVVAR